MKKETLEHLAELSYVNLSDEEAEEFKKQLNSIFKHIEKTLQSVSPDKTKEGLYTKDAISIFNDDEVNCPYMKSEMLLNAKREKNGFILVPKVIEEEE